ncbi:MAG: hypothetical protein QOJ65_1774 [Fimbriimonadaceae bacterium]|nr:hypothetical protein [Fimbriimonadaceae bacterium]
MPWEHALPFGDPAALKEVPRAAKVTPETKAALIQFGKGLLEQAKTLNKPTVKSKDDWVEEQVARIYATIGKPLTDEELAQEDPRGALDIALASAKRDKALAAFVGDHVNTAPRCCEIALSNIKDPALHDQAAYDLCERYAKDEPDRVAATALKMAPPRGTLLALAGQAYSRKNPAAAAHLCDLAAESFLKKYGDIPPTLSFDPPPAAPKMPPLGALYYIASADTPKVRALLEKYTVWTRELDKKIYETNIFPDFQTGYGNQTSMLMLVAGAWAQIELPRADSLVTEALKANPTTRVHTSDVNVDGTVYVGYLHYLIGVAKRDGKKAGKLANDLGGMPRTMAASGVFDEIWHDYPDQTREFQSVCGDRFVASVDERQILERIRTEDEWPAEIINQIGMDFDDPFAANRRELPRFLCEDLASGGEVDQALKISSILEPDYLKATAYMGTAHGVAFQHPEKALAIYEQAAGWARRNDRGAASDLVDIANSAITVARR